MFLSSVTYMPNKLYYVFTECKDLGGRLYRKCIDESFPSRRFVFWSGQIPNRLQRPVTSVLKSVRMAPRPTAQLGCQGRLRRVLTFEGRGGGGHWAEARAGLRRRARQVKAPGHGARGALGKQPCSVPEGLGPRRAEASRETGG